MSFLQVKKIVQILQSESRTEEQKSYLEQFVLLLMPLFNKYQKRLLKLICDCLYLKTCQQYQILSEEGNKCNQFIILLQGQIVLFRNSKKQLETPQEFIILQKQLENKTGERQFYFKTIDQVGSVSDIEFIKRQNYKYSILTNTECQIVHFNEEQYKLKLTQLQQQELIQKSGIYFLSQVQLFQSFDEKTLQNIYFNLNLKSFKIKEFVLKEQETIKNFYIVKSGIFQVQQLKQIYQDREPFKMYQQGQFFGHFEIIQQIQTRKYTIICVEPGELYCMNETIFKQKILHNESMLFKLKVIPILQNEIEDLLKRDKPIKIENFPKIKAFPALMAKKQNKYLTNRTSQFKPISQQITGQKISLNIY